MIVNIQRITPEATYPLRRDVMEQTDPVKLGDDNPLTLHVGAYVDGVLVGIASVYQQSPPDDASNPTAWRLRGMATLPDVRGKGYARMLLKTCIGYIAAQNGTILWCNARSDAVGFYEKIGFTAYGEPYMGLGNLPHYFMTRPITPDEANPF